MAIESTILQLILHAPDFVEGVINIVKTLTLEEGSGATESTDDFTLDEVAKEVKKLLWEGFLDDVNRQKDTIEQSILSKVQSMLDRGFTKMESRLLDLVPKHSLVSAEVEVPSSPVSQEEKVQESTVEGGSPKVKVRKSGRRSSKRR